MCCGLFTGPRQNSGSDVKKGIIIKTPLVPFPTTYTNEKKYVKNRALSPYMGYEFLEQRARLYCKHKNSGSIPSILS